MKITQQEWRAKTTIIALNLLVMATLPTLSAHSKTPEEVFQSLNSTYLKVFKRVETQKVLSKTSSLRSWGLAWHPPWLGPATDLDSSDTASCHHQLFKQALLTTPDQRELILQKFWKNCEPQWRQNSYGPFTHSHEILRTDFEPSQHPEVRQIQWTLKNQKRLQGYLFLKGPYKRPFIILRTGIFSHLRSTVAERFLMMQLFDEGPYHLLVLPSNSGSDYISDNHQIHFGDNSEGLQTLEILNQLQNSSEPLNQYISKIHLVGISLGGYGLLQTLIKESEKATSLVDRSLFLCPALDLPASLHKIEENPLLKFFLQIWMHFRLRQHRKQMGLSPNDSLYDTMKAGVNQNPSVFFRAPDSQKNLLPPNVPPSVTLSPESSQTNATSTHPLPLDTSSTFTTFPHTKAFFLWTDSDLILPPEHNSAKLKDLLTRTTKFPNTSFLSLPRGLHCSLPASYHWPAISTTVRGYLDPDSLITPFPPLSKTLLNLPRISSITIHKLELENQIIKLHLLIQFQNPLTSRYQSQIMAIPSSYSFHQWAFADYNDELEQTLVREFSSRLQWTQTSTTTQVQIN